ncbi:rod shape-determining protein MreD [Marinoscillum sp. MHG1-6]|uniref:rod shape-determining protein MreD n=1 Tax=Marinoscillum sp. MHG1-6 TaxID=2959627 RepID=UPI0021577BDA|nr:rod shape-determining protein MreD [Marinoscillum sp. MHG1-6]
MIRINYIRQVIHLFVFLILQIPLINKFILFDKAFGFFYLGFILFLPVGLNRNLTMIIGFLSGLVIDVFSNTPGIHAAATVLITFVKDYWYSFAIGEDEEPNLSWNDLKGWGSVKFLLPLITLHHTIIFVLENNGFTEFVILMNKILLSSAYTFITVFSLSLLLAPTERK